MLSFSLFSCILIILLLTGEQRVIRSDFLLGVKSKLLRYRIIKILFEG